MNDRNGNALAVGDRAEVEFGFGNRFAIVQQILGATAFLRFDDGWHHWVAERKITKVSADGAPITTNPNAIQDLTAGTPMPPITPPDLAALAAAMEAKAVSLDRDRDALRANRCYGSAELALIIAKAYRDCAAMVREAIAGKAGGA